MSAFELFILAVGLSMDAFAVAMCKGLAMKKMSYKKAATIGAYFGFFQGFMPAIGYIFGVSFQSQIKKIDHWIAFLLLSMIGCNMIRESFGNDETDTNDSVAFKVMIFLAIATSIDALAAGVNFAFLPNVNVWLAIILIGIITFNFSFIGVKIGNMFGTRYKAKAEFMGGLVLILLGFKILLEHLFFQ